jgi:uncharacterized protein
MLRVEAGDMKDDIPWLVSRFAGYVGLMGFLGSRFLAKEQALAPLLEEIARRALFIVDDGNAQRPTISRLTRFAREVEKRGFVVAPISAIVERNAGVARAAEARR